MYGLKTYETGQWILIHACSPIPFPDCKFDKIELGLLVDGSDSTQSNFSTIKSFLKNLTRSFNVSSSGTRVGIIIYSTNASLEITLDQNSNASNIEEAIDNLMYPGGLTNIGLALNQSITGLFNSSIVRASASKILLVITDGTSTDDITVPTTLLADTNVTSFVLGIGDGYSRYELDQIALGVTNHVFTADVNNLEMITTGLREALCLGK